jgi:hypothetical protein
VLFTRDSFFYQYELLPVHDTSGALIRIDTVLVHQVTAIASGAYHSHIMMQVSMAGVTNDPLLLALMPPARQSRAVSVPAAAAVAVAAAATTTTAVAAAAAAMNDAVRATVDAQSGRRLPNMHGSATCVILGSNGDLSLVRLSCVRCRSHTLTIHAQTNAETNQQLPLAGAVEQFWLAR